MSDTDLPNVTASPRAVRDAEKMLFKVTESVRLQADANVRAAQALAVVDRMVSRVARPAASQPVVSLDPASTLRDAEELLASLEIKLVDMRAELAAAEQLVVQWTRRAELSVREGRDDMARQALVQRTAHEACVATYQADIAWLEGALSACRDDMRRVRLAMESTGASRNADGGSARPA